MKDNFWKKMEKETTKNYLRASRIPPLWMQTYLGLHSISLATLDTARALLAAVSNKSSIIRGKCLLLLLVKSTDKCSVMKGHGG